jgi:hypothetical protein
MKFIKQAIMALSLCLSFAATADQVLVVDPNYAGVAGAVTGRLQAAGHTVTTTTSAPTSLTGYQQVWDLRYSAALTTSETTLYSTFIRSGGFAYFVTENPGCCMARNNSVAALVTELGGGTTQIGPGWANNVETNMNTTYMTAGLTVNYAAVAAIVNSQGIPLISDSSGAVSGMSWIGRAGALSAGVTGTIVTVADINWLDSTRFGTAGSQTAAQLQNQQALDDIIRGIVAGTVAGTISAGGNGAGASNGNTGSSTPTVTGATTNNVVVTATTRASSTDVVSTVFGTGVSTSTDARGTPVSVTTESKARGTQTSRNLSVNQTFTTVTTTPVATTTVTVTPFTTTTTTTTPVTVTTTTTPVTITTYSDNTTVTTTGTAVVTTATTNQVATATQTGTTSATAVVNWNDIVTNAITNTYSTRVDQLEKLQRANVATNIGLDSRVTDRQHVRNGRFVGDEEITSYVSLENNRSGAADGYSSAGNRIGVGVDYRAKHNWMVGAQYNRNTSVLSGDTGGGATTKDHFGLYSLYTLDNWMFKNDIGFAHNRYDTNYSIPELGLKNSLTMNGVDTWASARIYTPDVYGVRPFLGGRLEKNRASGATSTGSELTSITYDPFSSLHYSREIGVNIDRPITDNLSVIAEGSRNTLNYKTVMGGVSYRVKDRADISLKAGQQQWDNVRNNMFQISGKVLF